LIDQSRRVVFVNSACEQLTGWTSDELIGVVCDFASHVEPADIRSATGTLCPPPSAFDVHPQIVAKQFVHKESGRSVTLPVYFMPLQDADETVFVLGVAGDVKIVPKPPDMSLVSDIHAELAALRHSIRERHGFKTIVGKSLAMQRILRQINTASETRGSVFLYGAKGTGKDHVARIIHYESSSKAKAFVPLDCKDPPPDELSNSIKRLLETDWQELSPIAALQPGCLFLNNVESMPRDLQQRIVDFLTSPQATPFRKNVTLISASTIPPVELMGQSRLLEELYFALTSLQLELPALCDRPDDLGLLAQYFLEECNSANDRQVAGFATDVQELFNEYNWPGNLDELKLVVQEAHRACDENSIRVAHLPFRFRTGLDAQSIGPETLFEPLEATLARVEREQIEAALEATNNNKAKAATLLGMTRASLYRKLENLGLHE
jgi:DNA-binding NtrC family response regulator